MSTQFDKELDDALNEFWNTSKSANWLGKVAANKRQAKAAIKKAVEVHIIGEELEETMKIARQKIQDNSVNLTTEQQKVLEDNFWELV